MVYPHGSPQLAATGKVLTLLRSAPNSPAVSIIVQFPTLPAFASKQKSKSEDPVLFFATRLADYIPWVELFRQGHYEIEIAPASPEKE